MKSIFTLTAALILGLGIALGGYLGGQGLVKSRLGDRSVSVKGLSEREVKADLALWALRFVATGNELAETQAQVKSNATAVTNFLKSHGFSDDEIELQAPQVTDRLAQAYSSGPVESRFIIAQQIVLRSTDVDKVAAANKDTSELVEQGVVLSNEYGPVRPSYLFTGIAALKPEMIEEATKRAREAAETFAADSGSSLGGIRRAWQGQFEILPRDNTPGTQETEQVAKTVRVVSTIEYLLVD
ncbi:SIMPL domain-containing protein [Parvibaculum sp.]|uniref:SIMPL domain-containing protein n=1 Tax=Parvibaculum sp. TaxID=2024848 RepID=UPI002725A808|nr:SIMPL domain-containing protein [Parvibaculum sp.]MDO9127632.1 SIMPL domain-containing protein [Parvibaculum sp.]MDP1626559.1 SIMPL domain-containing protein [Parvibaculum sp.]MDP2150481.1 SIMPL domain-containing protein [Parvibaculum sp.]MDP3327701.1 SIMPL domain-containing protein [Parvibaculum sp.]